MGRIARGWAISKASWRVLAQDRELIWIPVLSGVAALLAFAAIAVPGVVLMGGIDAAGTGDVATWLIGVLATVAATWVFALGQAAMIAGAAERMDGGDPTIPSALAAARARAGRILEWAIMATVVAIVLDQIEQRLGVLGRLVSWIGSTAFSVLSFLALPVIVFEDVGAIEAFKRSSRLLKGTWGEQLTFNFGIGVISMLAVMAGVAVAAVLAVTGIAVLAILGIVAAVVWTLVVVAVSSALSAVFKAALYRWATGLPVDEQFEIANLEAAFHQR